MELSRTTSSAAIREGGVAPPLFTRPFVLAALANAMLNLAAFLFVHLPGYLLQLGAGESRIGRIMAAQALGAVIAWPFVGRAMDVRGRRVVILGGVVAFVAAIGLYLSIQTLGARVYAVRLLDGVATAMWYTALYTFAADLVPVNRRTEGLALFGISGLIPIGLGAAFGDLLLMRATYRELFIGALGFSLVGLLLCLPLRDVRPVMREHSVPARGLVATAGSRHLVPVWLAAFAFFAGVVTLFNFMKTFVIATGVGTVGSFFAAYAGTAVALRICLGWLPDRLGARRTLGLAMSCYAFGIVVLTWSQAPLHVVAAGILCGTGHGYTYPVLFSLVVARSDAHERGGAAAFFTMLDWLALLLAGPLVGFGIERTGHRTTFVVLALLLAIGIGLFYALDRRHHDDL